MGITCALCHSTVDNSFAPGIGTRLDGWAARDLNVGAIIALSPSVQPFVDLLRLVQPGINAAAVRSVLRSWGPGKFDAELLLDGKALRPDGKSAATLIPPAFGLAGVNLHTWTGWGSVTHWNAFVANLEMQGSGTFYDPRLNDASKFPIAAASGFADVRKDPDLITGKLAALHVYQLSLPAPRAAAWQLQRIGGETRQSTVRRQGGLRTLPRAAAVHRARLEHAYARGDRHRRIPGDALARRALSHGAAQGPVDAHQGRVLSRRALCHARATSSITTTASSRSGSRRRRRRT